MTFLGMDADQVKSFGQSTVQGVNDAVLNLSVLRNEMEALTWTGIDRERAFGAFVDAVTVLKGELEEMRKIGEFCKANAEDQERCSEVPGGGATCGGTPGGSSANGGQSSAGRSERGEISDYLRELKNVPDGKFGIIDMGGDPPRYVVLVPGVVGPLDPSNRDYLGAGVAATEIADPYAASVARALNDLPAGAQIMMVSHSQGGMAAVNAAAMTNAHVQNIVSIGTGAYNLDRLPSDVHLTAIENSSDLVPSTIRVGQLVSDPGSAVKELFGNNPSNVSEYMFSDGRINPFSSFGASHKIDTYIDYVEDKEFYNPAFSGDYKSITYFDG